MNKDRIAVIGFGAGTLGFLQRAIENNLLSEYDIDVFERGKDVLSSSLSGIRSDGKLIVTDENVSDLNIPIEIQRNVKDIYLRFLENGDCGKEYFSFKDSETYMKFFREGFNPIRASYRHIGTDTLKELLPKIYDFYSSKPGINIMFNQNVVDIERVTYFGPGGVRYKIVCSTEHPMIQMNTYDYKMVVVAVGRSGYKLIEKMSNYYNRNGKQMVDIGVRFECPDMLVNQLNQDNYEWKVRYPTKTGYTGRTFCNNPSGLVVVENYRGVKTVNGHANKVGNSTNTNFAILISADFTEPFNEPNQFGESIAKMCNQLAGGDKVLLQTVGDFLNYKRTKKIGRTKPTLNANEYTLGDLNLAYGAKIRESLADFLTALGRVIPDVLQEDNLLYGAEVKFYSNKMKNDEGVYFVGDCSGKTRNIIMASAHGYLTADEILTANAEAINREAMDSLNAKSLLDLPDLKELSRSGFRSQTERCRNMFPRLGEKDPIPGEDKLHELRDQVIGERAFKQASKLAEKEVFILQKDKKNV